MLVSAATPEATPVVSTPPASRKRKHHAMASAEDASPLPLDASDDMVLARDTSRPRLTVSRHPVFLSNADGSPFHLTDLCAVNRQLDKVGFKYAPAGLADPGAAIPYRTIESNPMGTRVSWEDRSPSVRVTQDGLGLAGDKGFRSARANVGVQEGRWYLEVKIDKGDGDGTGEVECVEGAHVRLGWGRREAPLNGPVGLDGYSYGVRDKTGDKVTLSRSRPYGRPFGTGDVVGLYISLPPRRQPNPKDADDPAHIHRERIAIDFKGQEYFESLDYPQSKEMLMLMEHPSKAAKSDPPHQTKKSATVKNLPSDRARNKPAPVKTVRKRPLPTLQNSKIAFFVNGECQGVAFQDIYDYLQLRPVTSSRKGKDKHRRNRDGPCEHTENNFDDGTLGYYPFFSLFGGAQIHLNPGPEFAFPPPPDVDAVLSSEQPSNEYRTWRPISERYAEFMAHQWALDAKEEHEHKAEAEMHEEYDAQEEKKRAQRERKRKAEAARRKRKAEEKKAAAAGTAPPGSTPVPDAGPIPAALSSPALSVEPSRAPSVTVDIDMDMVDALLTSVGLPPARTPTPGASKDPQWNDDPTSMDVHNASSAPQTPPSSDFGGLGQQEWPFEDDDVAAARQLGLDEEPGVMVEQELVEELTPQPHVFGFQESSTRTTDQ